MGGEHPLDDDLIAPNEVTSVDRTDMVKGIFGYNPKDLADWKPGNGQPSTITTDPGGHRPGDQ